MNEVAEQLAQLRRDGADRLDPVRFRYLESFAERLASGHRAPSQKHQEKLEQSLAEYQARARYAGDNQTEAHEAMPSPLAALVRTLRDGADNQAPRDLKALAPIREAQARQHLAARIHHAITQTPGDAGPLNAHRQVARALGTLRTISPAYLERLVTYMDDLMVLEKANKK